MDSRWLKDIRDSQKDFECEEPEGLWEGIEAGLAGEGSPARRRFPFLWAMAAASVAAATVLLAVLPDRVDDGTDAGPALAAVQENDVDVLHPQEDDLSIAQVPEAEFSGLMAYAGGERLSTGTRPQSCSGTEDTGADGPAMSESTGQPSESLQSIEAAESPDPARPAEPARPSRSTEPSEPSGSSVSTGQDGFGIFEDSAQPHGRRKSGGRGLRLGVSVSNIAGSSSSSQEYAAFYGSSVTRQLHSFSENGADFPDSRGYACVMQSNVGNEVSSTVRNRQPVQAGVTVAWSFTDRFSAETGVTYSCLVSDLSSGTDAGRYSIRQTLHYVGVPLSLRYDFLKAGGFRLYVSAGGQVEKCVAGNTRTDYFADGRKISSENGKISVDPLQWSVNAHFGAQYDFAPWAGLYLEPGAAYYFSNGSPVNCIYNECPFNFSLRAGLRFNLPAVRSR